MSQSLLAPERLQLRHLEDAREHSRRLLDLLANSTAEAAPHLLKHPTVAVAAGLAAAATRPYLTPYGWH